MSMNRSKSVNLESTRNENTNIDYKNIPTGSNMSNFNEFQKAKIELILNEQSKLCSEMAKLKIVNRNLQNEIENSSFNEDDLHKFNDYSSIIEARTSNRQ
jgi:hypothetical protein